MVLAVNLVLYFMFLHFAEASNHPSVPQPRLTATVQAPNTSTTVPDSTGAAVAEDHSGAVRYSFCRSLTGEITKQWST